MLETFNSVKKWREWKPKHFILLSFTYENLSVSDETFLRQVEKAMEKHSTILRKKSWQFTEKKMESVERNDCLHPKSYEKNNWKFFIFCDTHGHQEVGRDHQWSLVLETQFTPRTGVRRGELEACTRKNHAQRKENQNCHLCVGMYTGITDVALPSATEA